MEFPLFFCLERYIKSKDKQFTITAIALTADGKWWTGGRTI